jgi:predicted PolB exonuclease-like 3'-5' exonuclease
MPEPLKPSKNDVFVFDIETVPCADTIRKIYGITLEDDEAIRFAFDKAGATFETPAPFLKTVMQKVVCISMLHRERTKDGPTLHLYSYPDEGGMTEAEMVYGFLKSVGEIKPQLVGYNSTGFDLTVLYQRAIILGIDIKEFCQRPAKPWDPMPDYFSASNDWNVDLCKVVGGWGKETPSLVEICRACGTPAKEGGDGSDVLAMYEQGKIADIIAYCESDVIATYRLWLRLAKTCGFIGDTSAEEAQLEQLLTAKAEGARA